MKATLRESVAHVTHLSDNWLSCSCHTSSVCNSSPSPASCCDKVRWYARLLGPPSTRVPHPKSLPCLYTTWLSYHSRARQAKTADFIRVMEPCLLVAVVMKMTRQLQVHKLLENCLAMTLKTIYNKKTKVLKWQKWTSYLSKCFPQGDARKKNMSSGSISQVTGRDKAQWWKRWSLVRCW